MPAIKEYNRQVANTGPIDMPRATAASFGGAQAEGLMNLGQGISQAGEALRQHQERKDIATVNRLIAEQTTQKTMKLQDAQKAAAPGAPEFEKQVDEELQKDK